MKVGEMIEFLSVYTPDDEIEIEVFETITGKYVDSTADIVFSIDADIPTLRIDVEAAKFEKCI